MKVKYGTFTFDIGEATFARFQVKHKYSARLKREMTHYYAHIEGMLTECTEGALHTRIGEIIEAFSTNGQELALLRNDGSKTHHYLKATGDDVIQKPNVMFREWPDGGVAEYVSKRNFRITAHSIQDTHESEWVQWTETVRQVGTGLPYLRWRPTKTGTVAMPVWNTTPIQIVQEGRAIGLNGYILDASSIRLLGAGFEDSTQSIFEPESAPLMGERYMYYPFHWRFVYNMATPPYMIPRSL